jgi:hypothetical protein
MIDLKGWLDDRRRSYAVGLSFFKALASEEERKRMLPFFLEASTPPPFDAHFTVLVNQLRKIAKSRGNLLTLPAPHSQADPADPTVLAMIPERREQPAYTGLRIVRYTDLPADQRKDYDEIRRITPLYASLFAEMQDRSIADDRRAEIAAQVVELYDRKRALWARMDQWAERGGVKLELDERAPQAEDPMVEGMRIACRMERLKENIRRNKQSIERHERNGKLNYLEKSRQRLGDYERELEELERQAKQHKP